MLLLLLFICINSFSPEPIGYEHFKLDMNTEDIHNIFNKYYSEEWMKSLVISHYDEGLKAPGG